LETSGDASLETERRDDAMIPALCDDHRTYESLRGGVVRIGCAPQVGIGIGMTQRGHRFWFHFAIFCSVGAVLDLVAIAVEGFIQEMPDPIRCGIVNAVLSLPFETEYKIKEDRARRRTDCMQPTVDETTTKSRSSDVRPEE
jgi:hypothetical protein